MSVTSSGTRMRGSALVIREPDVRRWVRVCALAETVGMTAAAAAARGSQAVVGDSITVASALAALCIVVAGGLVEGTALGLLQARALARWLPLCRRRWLVTTIVVAGLGWAVGAAPGVFAGDENGAAAPWALVVLGGAALGVVMGAALGAAQAWALPRELRHRRRWIGANATAWAPAMAVIFAGASAPGQGWPVWQVVLLGTATGVVAGATLGAISGGFLRSLDGPPVHNRLVMWLLRSRAHPVLDRSLIVLRLTGRVTGRTIELPVMYTATSSGLVVVAGWAERKRWWRNLAEPTSVLVLHHGSWVMGVADVLQPHEEGYDAAVAAYRGRWRRVRLTGSEPVIRISTPQPVAALSRPLVRS